MKNKNFGRKRQAIYILSNRKSTRIIKTLMDFFFFIKVKIKMVCFSVPSCTCLGVVAQLLYHRTMRTERLYLKYILGQWRVNSNQKFDLIRKSILSILQTKNAYDIMPVGKMIRLNSFITQQKPQSCDL